MPDITTGMLGDGIPFLAVGSGPPRVMVQALTSLLEVPTRMERRIVMPLSGDFRVYLVNRKQGLSSGESMSSWSGRWGYQLSAAAA